MKRNAPLSPNLLAHGEWFTQRLKLACLNKFVVVGEEHLDHVSQDGRRHCSEERPHSSPDQLPPDFTVSPEGWRIVREGWILPLRGESNHFCIFVIANQSLFRLSNSSTLNGDE